MTTIAVVYHSGFGHTQALAEAVAKGAQAVPGTKVSLIAAVSKAPKGFAVSVPAYLGALPCTGSNIDVRPGWMFPDPAMPRPP